jgi:hypothetical protein
MAALLTLLMLTLVASAPRIALAESQSTSIPARIRLFQEYKVPVSGLRNTFEYKIEAVESNAPLPVDEKGGPLHSFTLTRDDELWLTCPVEVTADPNAAPYVYHYKIGPAQTTLPDGLYYADVLSTSLSPGINEYHIHIPYRKETFQTLWEQEGQLIHETCTHKNRTRDDISHWCVRDWRVMTGDFHPQKPSGKSFSTSAVDTNGALDYIRRQKGNVICLNDNELETDSEKHRQMILEAFEALLPEKSSFEI